ncbi:MAG: hypothetical protein ACLRWM_08565 [Streptococcus sp.]
MQQQVNIAEKTAIAEEDIASEESIAAFNAEEGENVAAFSTSENDAEEFAAEANSDENLPILIQKVMKVVQLLQW